MNRGKKEFCIQKSINDISNLYYSSYKNNKTEKRKSKAKRRKVDIKQWFMRTVSRFMEEDDSELESDKTLETTNNTSIQQEYNNIILTKYKENDNNSTDTENLSCKELNENQSNSSSISDLETSETSSSSELQENIQNSPMVPKYYENQKRKRNILEYGGSVKYSKYSPLKFLKTKQIN
ncbi:hypothetical protein ABK040_011890 [Willaertia magna]